MILQIALPAEYAKYIYRKRKQRVKMKLENTKSEGRIAPRSPKTADENEKENSIIHNQRLSRVNSEGDKMIELINKSLRAGKNIESVERANNSFTGISTDQGIDDEESNCETNWIDKKFQEAELKELLNLFKMHFNKEENKWNKIAFIDKHLDIQFEMKSTEVTPKQNNLTNMLPIVRDTGNYLQTPVIPSVTIDPQLAQKVIEEKHQDNKQSEAGNTQIKQHTQKSDHQYSADLDKLEKKIQELRHKSSRRNTPKLSSDNPVKKIMQMKNTLANNNRPQSQPKDKKELAEQLQTRNKKPKSSQNSVDYTFVSGFGKSEENRLDSLVSPTGGNSSFKADFKRTISSQLLKHLPSSDSKKNNKSKKITVDSKYIDSLIRKTMMTSHSKSRIHTESRERSSVLGIYDELKEKGMITLEDSMAVSLGGKKNSTDIAKIKKKILSKVGDLKLSQLDKEKTSQSSLFGLVARAQEPKVRLVTKPTKPSGLIKALDGCNTK